MNHFARFSILLVSAVAVIGPLSGASLAADAAPVVKAPVAAATPVWSGFYLGGHVGVAWTDWRSQTSFVAVPVPPAVGNPITGSFPGPDGTQHSFLGGVQAGYNWQYGNLVLGGEVDISFLPNEHQQSYAISSAALIAAGLGTIIGGPDGFVSSWSRQVDWLATARLRIGYTINPALLLYATGGLAVAGLESSVTYPGLVDTGGGGQLVPISAQRRWTEVGYAIGAGGEWALTRNISGKLEYLFVDLGDATRPIGTYLDTPCCRQTASVREQLKMHIARIGLNYRFTPQ
jgi:outer membrane immunogenic protein